MKHKVSFYNFGGIVFLCLLFNRHFWMCQSIMARTNKFIIFLFSQRCFLTRGFMSNGLVRFSSFLPIWLFFSQAWNMLWQSESWSQLFIQLSSCKHIWNLLGFQWVNFGRHIYVLNSNEAELDTQISLYTGDIFPVYYKDDDKLHFSHLNKNVHDKYVGKKCSLFNCFSI